MISHHHRCVFVHIPKCGGQSVESLFVSDVGLDWSSRAPLLLRERAPGEIAPPRLAHLTAQEYVSGRYIPIEMFREYLTFAVVRDPYFRAASTYRYLGFDYQMSFSDFISDFLNEASTEPHHPYYWFVRPQMDFLVDQDGQIQVDHVLHLERIDQELPPILKHLGLEVVPIPRANPTLAKRPTMLHGLRIARRHHRWPRRRSHWNGTLSETAKAGIRQLYGEDFRSLGYPE